MRDVRGRFTSDPRAPAIERFLAKCRFDPVTGCVVWTGGTSAGRGNSARYGVFWDQGRRHFAHRWSAIHILGLDVEGLTVGHCCPNTGGKPNTLCVAHLRPETLAENVAERNRRVAQSSTERQFWLLVQRGYEEAPAVYEGDPDGIPFFSPPAWFPAAGGDDCPF